MSEEDEKSKRRKKYWKIRNKDGSEREKRRCRKKGKVGRMIMLLRVRKVTTWRI